MIDLETLLEKIDASVFNGELLYVDKDREMLREYAERWLRAIASHEQPDEQLDAF